MTSDKSRTVSPAWARPRPWWRLHASTWIVTALVVALFIVANLAEFARLDVRNYFLSHTELGWPRVWQRSTTKYIPNWGSVPPEAPVFLGRGLAANVAVGALIVAITVVLIEGRRRRRQRLLQSTVGGMLLATAVVAGLLGWYLKLRTRYDTQQAVCATLGGKGPMSAMPATFESSLPVWMLTVKSPWLAGALRPFARATSFSMERVHPEFGGFAPISDLTTLEGFTIGRRVGFGGKLAIEVPFGDEDAVHVGGLRRLICLQLPDTTITDAGLEQLKGLTRLEQLDLTGTRITEMGLRHLAGMTAMEDLRLSDTEMGDEGLAEVARLSSLKMLDLGNTRVSDRGLEYLTALRDLEQLDLRGTNVSDEGLPHLYGLKELRLLILIRTNVTDDGVQRLWRANPRLGVSR